ncbi:hypothetical protein AGMMS49992_18770 [Clostridia bacterium]|nr:hypothetical protein AGMMS49992_18770 [Clostridia bacterium]
MSRKRLVQLVVAVFLLVIVVAGGRSIYKKIEKVNQIALELEEFNTRSVIQSGLIYNGKQYKPKNNILSVLFLGIDRTLDTQEANPGYRYHGQSDFVMLVVVDKDMHTITRLNIDRDSITDIQVLGILGDYAGTRQDRVSLAFSFGDGREQSAELTAEAVKRLLPNGKVDFFLAFDLGAISKMNDVVGGVTVQVNDDLTMIDPSWVPGAKITLQGKQTEQFVRSRMGVGGGTNEERMQRQNVFLSALSDILVEKFKEDISFVNTFFDALEDDMVSNIQYGRMVNEVAWAQGYEIRPIQTINGIHEIDQRGFMAFYLDEDAAAAWVIDTLYDPV